MTKRFRILSGMLLLGLLIGCNKLSPAEKAEVETDKRIWKIHRAIAEFYRDTGVVPSEPSQGFVFLMQDLGTPGWKGPYLHNIPPDAWGGQFSFGGTTTLVSQVGIQTGVVVRSSRSIRGYITIEGMKIMAPNTQVDHSSEVQ